MNLQCKKCLDLIHKNELHKHHYICYSENVSSEEIRDCYRGWSMGSTERLANDRAEFDFPELHKERSEE